MEDNQKVSWCHVSEHTLGHVLGGVALSATAAGITLISVLLIAPPAINQCVPTYELIRKATAI